MRGIFVKGMEMPKSCFDCPLLHGEYLYCTVTDSDLRYMGDITKRRNDDCPLVEIRKEETDER